MKKIILGMSAFMLTTLAGNAMTKQEQIQGELSKLGVSQEIINETVVLDRETWDLIRIGAGEVARQPLKNLLAKDLRNFVAADNLIVDDMLRNVESLENQKIFTELYRKYTPYAHERDYAEYSFLLKSGKIEEANKKMDEIINKYKGTWIEKFSLLGRAQNFESFKKTFEETLALMKTAKDTNSMGVTEESYYDFRLRYYDTVIANYAAKNENKKLVDYYLKNVGNDTTVPESVIVYYKTSLRNTLNNAITANTKIENKLQREKNVEKLKNTRMFKILKNYFPVNF